MHVHALKKIGSGLLDLVLPRFCALCGGRVDALPLCSACRDSLRPISGDRCSRCGVGLISEQGICLRCRNSHWAFDRAVPLFEYSGPFRRLLSSYKFGGRRSLAGYLADLCEESILLEFPERPIVPVPPRPGKLRARGWDQIEEIVGRLESRGHAVMRALERRGSSEQKRLGLGQRSENASASFRVKPGLGLKGQVLLLDDVMTTGATAQACAAALRAAGAERVDVLVLAAD